MDSERTPAKNPSHPILDLSGIWKDSSQTKNFATSRQFQTDTKIQKNRTLTTFSSHKKSLVVPITQQQQTVRIAVCLSIARSRTEKMRLAFDKIRRSTQKQLTAKELGELRKIKPKFALTSKGLMNSIELLKRKQRVEQKEFLCQLLDGYIQDQEQEIEGLTRLKALIQAKVRNYMASSFFQLQNYKNGQNRPKGQANGNKSRVKALVIVLQCIWRSKQDHLKQNVFNRLLEIKLGQRSAQNHLSLKMRGRILLLSCHSKSYLGKAFWKWYFQTSETGKARLSTLMKGVVLNSNISKTAFFYRLLEGTKIRSATKANQKKQASIQLSNKLHQLYYQRLNEAFMHWKRQHDLQLLQEEMERHRKTVSSFKPFQVTD